MIIFVERAIDEIQHTFMIKPEICQIKKECTSAQEGLWVKTHSLQHIEWRKVEIIFSKIRTR
jgi:hypothetical protein